MPRLLAVKPEEASGQTKDLLDAVQKKLGMVPNLIRTFANSPAVLQAYLGFSSALENGVLSPQLREQIALAVGQANQCDYCLSAHTAIGKMVGLSEEDILDNRLAKSTDSKTQSALRFARSVVEKKGLVSDQDVEQVKSAKFTDAEIAEIIAAVSLNVFTNYFNHVAETVVDFPPAAAVEDESCTTDSMSAQAGCGCN